MKILLINNLYEPFQRGGAEKIAAIQVEGLRKLGHTVHIFSLRPVFSAPLKMVGRFYAPSFFAYLDKMPFWLRYLWHLADTFDFVNYFRIRQIIRREAIDCCITHNLCGVGRLSLLAMRKVKHLHVLHDIALLHPSGLMYRGQERILDSVLARLYQLLGRSMTSGIDIVISPSHWLWSLHTERGFFRTAHQKLVLPNPFPKVDGYYLPASGPARKFLYVGLLSYHKGVEMLLDAWQTIAADCSEASLQLIGECQDPRLLSKIEKGKGLDYRGRQDQETVRQAMRDAEVLIVPSLCYENSPTVIYEAVAAGLPFIASRLGGAVELCDRFGALSFEPDRESLTRAIRACLREKPRLKGLNENPGLDNTAYSRRLAELIDELN